MIDQLPQFVAHRWRRKRKFLLCDLSKVSPKFHVGPQVIQIKKHRPRSFRRRYYILNGEHRPYGRQAMDARMAWHRERYGNAEASRLPQFLYPGVWIVNLMFRWQDNQRAPDCRSTQYLPSLPIKLSIFHFFYIFLAFFL